MFSAQQSNAATGRGRGPGPGVGAQNPKIVFMKKTESGSAKEMFEKIKAVYKGKPKRQLDELLANHEINALTGRKRRVSIKTQKSYGDNLGRFINSLKEENMAIQNLDEITTKQVRRIFGSYERKGLSASRMKSMLGSVRRLGVWLGKDELCPDLEEMLEDPENGKRSYTAKEPKAWEANGVEVAVAIALIAEECPITALQFELAHEFGARVEEFLMFRPAKALRTEGEIWISDGTKGGRPRSVPIEFDSQRDVLRRVKELADKNPKGMLQAQKSDNLKQAKAHMRYLLYKLGITKKGMGITPHGLRHGYACRVYKKLTGEEAPVMGGGLVEVELDRSARQEIAYRMGHARVSVVSAYTGCHRTLSRSATQNLKQVKEVLEGDEDLDAIAKTGGIKELYLVGPTAEGKQLEKGGYIMIGYIATKNGEETQAQADGRAAFAGYQVAQRISQMLGKSCLSGAMGGLDPELPRFEIFLGRAPKAEKPAASNQAGESQP